MQPDEDDQQAPLPPYPRPGITADALAENLRRLGRPIDETERTRQRTMTAMQHSAQASVNHLPIHIHDQTGWTPPYAWDPTHTNYIPAIFTHPNFANNITHAQAPMDPPLV